MASEPKFQLALTPTSVKSNEAKRLKVFESFTLETNQEEGTVKQPSNKLEGGNILDSDKQEQVSQFVRDESFGSITDQVALLENVASTISSSTSQNPPNGEVIYEHLVKKEIPLGQATNENSSYFQAQQQGQSYGYDAYNSQPYGYHAYNTYNVRRNSTGGRISSKYTCGVVQDYASRRRQHSMSFIDINKGKQIQLQQECTMQQGYQSAEGGNARKVQKDPKQPDWDIMYNRLVQYKNAFGNCRVPKKYRGDKKDEEDYNLGAWVSKQRKDPLSMDQVTKLVAIGFDFTSAQSDWDAMYSRLVQYHDSHGNCLVPLRYKGDKKDELDPNLGSWVFNQRKRKEYLSPVQVTKLESIGFDFSGAPMNDPNKSEWDVMYYHLVQYKNKFGDCNVPLKYKGSKKNKDACNLGIWVCQQRKYQKSLTKDQVTKLISIGFDFAGANRMVDLPKWDVMYKRLVQYKEMHGNCLVPESYKGYKTNRNEIDLGTWVSNQRKDCKSLSTDQISKLEEIGFDFIGAMAQLGIIEENNVFGNSRNEEANGDDADSTRLTTPKDNNSAADCTPTSSDSSTLFSPAGVMDLSTDVVSNSCNPEEDSYQQ